MQVSVENTGKLERRMNVQIPAERVNQEITNRLRDLSRTARLNGFRPGKAPIAVIRQQFGAQVHREVIGELLQSSFAEAVTQNQLAPAGSPRIEPQSLAEGEDLKYVATFEVFPQIQLAPFARIQVERSVAEVAEEDIDAMIERLRKQRPIYSAVARGAQNGDKVVVDFEGSINGVAFAGGKGEAVAIVLGEGRMLPEFEQGLMGAVAGEAKQISLTFPADYRAADLAGKQADFKLQIKTLEAATLPALDEAFFSSLGVTEGGLAKLREDIVVNMRRELEQVQRAKIKQSVLDKLYEANPLEVPNSLIEAQIRDLQVEMLRRAGAKDASQAPAREPLVEPARRRVALGLILNEIVKGEKLSVDRAQVSARLNEMAAGYDDAGALRRSYEQNPDAMRQIENLVLEDQVVDAVLAQAKVHEVRSTFKELMRIEP
jgi:trigger factor